MTSTGDRFFFMHLQKTGGTTLVHRLPRHFHPAQIYPNASDGDAFISTISVRHLVERWMARRDEVRIVAGHFPLCTTELLGSEFTTLTMLRAPVERTLSYLRHHVMMTPDDRHKPLEEIYEDPFRFDGLVHNHMVKMLSLSSREMTEGALTRIDFDENRLAAAKERLASIDVVGVQERFEDFWRELASRFGWDLGEPARSNETVPVDVSDQFRARIAEDNSLDIELYEHALQTRVRTDRRRHPAPVS